MFFGIVISALVSGEAKTIHHHTSARKQDSFSEKKSPTIQ